MKNILEEPLGEYLAEKGKAFGKNALADKFRHEFPDELKLILRDKERYTTEGSPGKGQWTDCPWIAILDKLITTTPQKGYYPVFIFKQDMSGVYLSFNQGVTDVIDNYKRDAKTVLKMRAEDFRAKLEYNEDEFLTEIDLNSTAKNAGYYQAGNVLAKYYSKEELPTSDELRQDVYQFLEFYETIAYSDQTYSDDIEHKLFEHKQLRLHWRIERSSSLAKEVKKKKGYKCECCNLNFKDRYGEIGDKFIEAHHLKPISELGIGKHEINIDDDFAVLCSNCHSMIHKLDDPSDLDLLKKTLKTDT